MKWHNFWFFLLWVPAIAFAQQELSIYEIQYTTNPDGSSPHVGDTVVTYGIVTGIFQQYRFFMEEYPGGAWHGIYIFRGGNSTPSVSIGDSVRVVAVVSEYYGLTELDATPGNGYVEVLSSGHPLPGPTVLPTGQVSQEAYEGVLIKVQYAVAESLPNQYGEWWVNDGTGPLMIDDLGVPYVPILGQPYDIVGCLSYGYGSFRLEPRDSSDIQFSPDPPPVITNIHLFPEVPPADRPIIVQATITDNSMVVGDSLFYQVNGSGFQSVSHDSVIGTEYFFTIPGRPAGDSVDFFLWAMDDSSQVTVSETLSYTVIPNPPPIIHYVVWEPAYPFPNDPVLVRAKITDDTQVAEDSLYYRLNEGTFYAYPHDSTFNDLYFYHIPPQPGGTSVALFVVARDDAGAKTVSETLGYQVPDLSGILPMSALHVLDDQGNSILLGQQVTIRGALTVAGELGPAYYIQDATGGCVLYAPNFTAGRGDTVTVTGLVTQYNGLVELNDAEMLDQKFGEDPIPLVVTLAQLADSGEAYEGRLVQVRYVTTNATTFPTSGTLTIQDSTGSFTVYIDNDTDLGGQPTPTGPFHLTGVVSQYDPDPPYFEGHQIVPRGSFDLITGGDGSGSARWIPPFAVRGTPTDLSLEIQMGIDTLRYLKIEFPASTWWSGELQDLTLLGDGWVGATVTAYPESVRISGASVVVDTLIFHGVVVPDTGVYPVVVKTATSGPQGLRPIVVQPVLYSTTPIAQVQQPGSDGYTSAMEGQEVTVAGVVTFPAGVSSTDRTSLFLQDPTGGVNVYYSGALLPFQVGDIVFARGVVTEYNGLTEILVSQSQNLLRLDRGFAIPDTYRLRPGEVLKEAMEGRFLELPEGVVATEPALAGAGYTMEVWNGQVPVTVYIYPGTGIDVQSLRVGDRIQVYGVLGQYDADPPYTSGYQILPRFPEDVGLLQPPDTTAEVQLTLSTNVFAPDLASERLSITVTGPPDYSYSLKIFDLKGRIVRVFFEGSPARTGVVTWDGTKENGEKVPLGMYIVQLRAVKGLRQVVINRPLVISTPFE